MLDNEERRYDLLNWDFMLFAPCHSNARVHVIDFGCAQCNCFKVFFNHHVQLHPLYLVPRLQNLSLQPGIVTQTGLVYPKMV